MNAALPLKGISTMFPKSEIDPPSVPRRSAGRQKGSFMKRFPICLCALAVLFCTSAFYIPEDLVRDGTDPVSAFLQATIRRINDSWTMADREFNLAVESASKMSDNALEAAGQKMLDSIQAKAQDAMEKSGGLDASKIELPEDCRKQLESLMPPANKR